MEAKPAAQEAVQGVAANPQDAAKQEALAKPLADVLQEDKTLLGDIIPIISELQVETVKKGGKVIGVRVTTPKGRVFI